MPKKHLPKLVIPFVLLLTAVGIYFVVTGLAVKKDESLTVSGTLEAVDSLISPEIGGKVTGIIVNEGDRVKVGDPLFTIDDTLLQAQRDIAEAGLELAQDAESTADAAAGTAQANYDLVLAAANQETAAIRAADWKTTNPKGYTLPGGSFTQADWIAAAKNEKEAALLARLEIEKALNELLNDTAHKDFVEAEKTLLQSRFEVQSAQDVLAKASSSGNSELKAEAQDLYDEALTALENAQDDYDDLSETEAAEKILAARIDLVLASERVQAAQSRLASLQTGEDSLKVKAAQAALQQAQSALEQAAQSVAQSEANLALLDAQINKLTVTAPIEGIVLTRSIELGEVLSPGAAAITLGKLDPLIITVYVPESEVGLLSMGQKADMVVDSFPDENLSLRSSRFPTRLSLPRAMFRLRTAAKPLFLQSSFRWKIPQESSSPAYPPMCPSIIESEGNNVSLSAV